MVRNIGLYKAASTVGFVMHEMAFVNFTLRVFVTIDRSIQAIGCTIYVGIKQANCNVNFHGCIHLTPAMVEAPTELTILDEIW